MARKLIVEVILDSAAYAKQVKKAQAETAAFAGNLQRTGKSAETATVGVKGLGKTALTASAYFVGFNTAAEALRSTLDAGREAIGVQQQLQTQLRASGISWDDNKSRIEKSTAALSHLSAFTTAELLQSFTQLVRTTGDVNDALDLNKVAADLARGRNVSLTTAANALGKAYDGNSSALRRMGVFIPKTAEGLNAIRIVAQRYTGQAKAGADATDHLRTSIHELQAQIGSGVIPIMDRYIGLLDKLAGAYTKTTENSRSFWERLPVAGPLVKPFENLAGAIHQVGVELGFASDQMARAAPIFSREPYGPPAPSRFYPGGAPSAFFGYRPKGATVEQRNAWFDAMTGREIGRVQDITSLRGQISRLGEIARQIQARIQATRDITRRLTLEDQLRDVFRQRRQTRTTLADMLKQQAKDAADAAKAARQAAAEARQAAAELARGWLDFAIERAGATKTVSDDVRAYRALESWLKARIRQEGRTLELVRDLWETRQKIRDLNKKNRGDWLTGLTQVSSKGLANILAAGTGLDLAGRRILGANIAAAEIQPVHMHVNLDGREIASVVTKHQTRSGMRTAKQTSGFRG